MTAAIEAAPLSLVLIGGILRAGSVNSAALAVAAERCPEFARAARIRRETMAAA